MSMHDRHWRDRPVLVTGATGLVGAWLASLSSVIAPRCVGFVSLSGTANLSDRYSTASASDKTNMNAAYGVSNEASWRAAVASYDPMLVPLSTWTGRNAIMQWDTSDTTVPYTINGQAWDTKYGPQLTIRQTMVTSGGDHNTTPNDPSQQAATVAFLASLPNYTPPAPVGNQISAIYLKTADDILNVTISL